MIAKPSYSLALVEAIFVNIIWASSFIFVKLSLKDLGPLTIGGLRYFIGFLVLLPFMLRKGRLDALPRRMWLRLLLIGLSAYTIGNGAMFWSLKYLPATTVSFMMSTITLLVLFGSIFWLKEIPTRVSRPPASWSRWAGRPCFSRLVSSRANRWGWPSSPSVCLASRFLASWGVTWCAARRWIPFP
jgi:uncharacterized membrane protein